MTDASTMRDGARSFGEILTGRLQKQRRTHQPVRRNSYNVGEREGRFWRPVNPREIAARMRAAEQFNLSGKKAGKRNGPLGHIGLEVLRELYRLVCYKTGRLDPSIETLMTRIKRSRAAVVRALAALKEHGFLEWIRRTEPTDNEGRGPQVRQISNAYRFGLPKVAAQLVARLVHRGPVPDDFAHRRESEAAELAEMIARLPEAERLRATISDPSLAEALIRLGQSLGTNASSLNGQNPA
ncbi:hypothetical protein FHS96_003108 [Sphingomonas zeicaulis]|uniref:replication protein A n=1 Tax=Sphingomonas zeicaulis TaxID=1632740 RepID=UPI003D1C551A